MRSKCRCGNKGWDGLWLEKGFYNTELNRFHIYLSKKISFLPRKKRDWGCPPPTFPDGENRSSPLAVRRSSLVRRGENDPRRSPGEIFDGEIWGGAPIAFLPASVGVTSEDSLLETSEEENGLRARNFDDSVDLTLELFLELYWVWRFIHSEFASGSHPSLSVAFASNQTLGAGHVS